MTGKEVYVSTWVTSLYLGLAALLICIAGFGLFYMPPLAAALLLGVGFLYLGVFHLRTPIYRIHRDLIEVRLNPISKTRQLIYNDVIRVEEAKNKHLLMFVRAGAGERRHRLPLNLIDEENAEKMVAHIRREVYE